MTEQDKLEDACRSLLGEPLELKQVGVYGYPAGLALCVIDSVQSTGVKYQSVSNVVSRYRNYRKEQGCDPETDGTNNLLQTFTDLDGPLGWANAIGNRNRTFARPWAPLKAEAIFECARVLQNASITTTDELRNLGSQLETVRNAWLKAPGQKSGVTWHYLLMLAGLPGVKPDRMILRFVARALNVHTNHLKQEVVVRLVTETATRLSLTSTELDHAIWEYERRRR